MLSIGSSSGTGDVAQRTATLCASPAQEIPSIPRLFINILAYVGRT